MCVGWSINGSTTEVDEKPDSSVTDALADKNCIVVSHSEFDVVYMRRLGYEVTAPFHNTQVMAHLLNENTNFDLESCVRIYTGQEMDKRLNRADNRVWFTTDEGEKLELHEAFAKYPEQVMFYCQRDAKATDELYVALRALMHKRGWWGDFIEEHAPFTEVLVDMECVGIPINLTAAESLRTQLVAKAATQKAKLVEDLGYDINFDSPPQLRTVLFSKVWKQVVKLPITKEERNFLRGKEPATEPQFPARFEVERVGTSYVHGTVTQKGLGLEPQAKTDTGLWSTSTPVLMVYHGDHPIVSDLVAYRKTNKVIGTYLNAYPRFSHEGRLYGRFNQTGTVTGRLSHSNPNLGNQPAHGPLGTDIRGLFQGRLIVGDHSQLEPRLMAHFSGDPVLLDIYRNQRDIYLVTGEYIFGRKLTKEDEERQISKTLILALGYGAGAAKVAQILALNGFWTPVDRAKEYMAHLETLYEVFFKWKRHTHFRTKELGYVKTIGNRYRRLKWAYGSAKYKVRNKADRQAVNSIIQGSAADILRRNMLHTRLEYPELPLLNQVHDELIWEHDIHEQTSADHLAAQLQHICQRPGYSLEVPLVFEPSFCSSWADKGGGITLPDEGEDEFE